MVKGEVFANVWLTERIAIISPESGRVTAWLDLTGIRGPVRSGTDDVLNGIAYDAARDRLFVTGKYWPRLFEIRIKRSMSKPNGVAWQGDDGTRARQDQSRPARARYAARRLSRAAHGVPGDRAARHGRMHPARGPVRDRVRRGRRAARSIESRVARGRGAVAFAAARRSRSATCSCVSTSAFRCRAGSAAAVPTPLQRCSG